MDLRISLLCAGTAFIIPRATTFICDHSHPLLERESNYLNEYLPKWLILACHAERSYCESSSKNDISLTWHASLYDSLWITAFFFPMAMKSVRKIRLYRTILKTVFNIGLLFAATYGIECTRRLVENLLPYVRTSIPSERSFGMLFSVDSRDIGTEVFRNLSYFISLAVQDVASMTLYPIQIAFKIGPPDAMRNRYPSLFPRNFTEEEYQKFPLASLYETIDLDEVPFDEIDEKNCPISLDTLKHPVRLKGCGHIADKENVNKWFLDHKFDKVPCFATGCEKTFNVNREIVKLLLANKTA